MHRHAAAALSASIAIVACACSSRTFAGDDGGGGDASVTDVSTKDGQPFGDVSTSDVATQTGDVVYAHSPDTLYALDPKTKAVTVIGPFTGCSEVIDIALDKSSTMFATTLDGLYRIERTNAECTQIETGSYPNSLSFVPAGTLDANVEALVGYVGDQYVRIDEASGAITTVGSIGGGYSSSGDIVSVAGGGTYLTVKGGPNSCNDCLIQVDPKTGAFLLEWGPLGHTNVFGIAFWGGSVYGFDDAGAVFQVDFNGLAIQTTTIAVPNAPPNLQFFGAGSTTIAPLTPN